MAKGKGPIKRIQVGAVSASVFANKGTVSGEERTFYSVVLQRAYEKDGKWNNTDSFRENDIAKAQLALRKAEEFIWLEARKNGEAEKE